MKHYIVALGVILLSISAPLLAVEGGMWEKQKMGRFLRRQQRSAEQRQQEIERILPIIQLIREAPIESLLDVDFLESFIPQLGLHQDWPHLYPPHLLPYCDTGLRIWQNPRQLAQMLVFLASKKISSFLEIGSAEGGNFIVVTEYLKRFNPSVRALAVEPRYGLTIDVYVTDINPDAAYLLDYSTSDRFLKVNAMDWDFCFIDGNHEKPEIDFQLFKDHSKILGFHDIVDQNWPAVQKLWESIKYQYSDRVEFTDQYEDAPNFPLSWMGIGILNMESRAG